MPGERPWIVNRARNMEMPFPGNNYSCNHVGPIAFTTALPLLTRYAQSYTTVAQPTF